MTWDPEEASPSSLEEKATGVLGPRPGLSPPCCKRLSWPSPSLCLQVVEWPGSGQRRRPPGLPMTHGTEVGWCLRGGLRGVTCVPSLRKTRQLALRVGWTWAF